MDRIDCYYFSVSTRIDLKEETRIKATSDEAAQWVEDSKSKGGCFIKPKRFIRHTDFVLHPKLLAPLSFTKSDVIYFLMIVAAAPPNFISDIFYLCNALGHYGYIRTIQTYEDFGKALDDYQRHQDMLNGDGSWMGVRTPPFNQSYLILPSSDTPSSVRANGHRQCQGTHYL